MRLRATAEPNVRVAIAKPNRAESASFATTDKLKYASLNFLPRCRTARNSAGWCNRLHGSNVSLLMNVGIARKSCATVYGQRRLRPLARRRASRFRPLFVAIRARKPWVRARWRLLGLKVRFIAQLQAKIRGKPGNRPDLRKAARVLRAGGRVNRRTLHLELDSLPFRYSAPSPHPRRALLSETLWNRCLRVLESELPVQQFNT